MANKASLPTKAELNALIELLAATDDEADEVNSAGEPLTSADVTNLAEDLVGRLERGMAEMRSKAEDVPAALSNTVQLLQDHIGEETRDGTTEEWVDSLLAGRVPPGRGQPTGMPSFRNLRRDLLTEDDIEMLRQMAEEIRSQEES
jgi:hypothetical protein